MYLFGTWLAAYLDWCKVRASKRPVFWLTVGFAFNFLFSFVAGALLGTVGVLLWLVVAMAFLPLFMLCMFKFYSDAWQAELDWRRLRRLQKQINRNEHRD